ncbi:MAG: sulfite exporter TauE/SafE family protein [Candidatus Peregrinibacteria bacterium]|nr:sulfite exporter TauE/SafE family protein [Candidatus Peregrinibacteria bacterium]
MTNIILCLVIGLVAGTLSGLLGIGGGIIIVPALIFVFGMSQHQAQGTTLALMVPPIGLLAAWTYYKEGYVDLKIAALICLGFFIGGLIGASLSLEFSEAVLKKCFGVTFMIIAIKMTFF